MSICPSPLLDGFAVTQRARARRHGLTVEQRQSFVNYVFARQVDGRHPPSEAQLAEAVSFVADPRHPQASVLARHAVCIGDRSDAVTPGEGMFAGGAS